MINNMSFANNVNGVSNIMANMYVFATLACSLAVLNVSAGLRFMFSKVVVLMTIALSYLGCIRGGWCHGGVSFSCFRGSRREYRNNVSTFFFGDCAFICMGLWGGVSSIMWCGVGEMAVRGR